MWNNTFSQNTWLCTLWFINESIRIGAKLWVINLLQIVETLSKQFKTKWLNKKGIIIREILLDFTHTKTIHKLIYIYGEL